MANACNDARNAAEGILPRARPNVGSVASKARILLEEPARTLSESKELVQELEARPDDGPLRMALDTGAASSLTKVGTLVPLGWDPALR